MAIGLSAAACNADAIEDYVNDNFGTGGGDAASTTGSDSSSSQSSSAGTSGSTTAGTGGAGSGVGGAGAGGEPGTGGGGAGGEPGTGGGGAGGEPGTGGGSTTAGTGGAGGTGGDGTGGGAPPADPACGPDTATFAQVRPILENCANQYCHGSDAPSAGLDLREAAAFGELVNQDASSCSSEHALVVPFMPSSSYLLNKLKDVDLCDPDEIKMPPGGSLSDADMKTITDWICAGAPAE